jgi:hypothetical protein
VRNRKQAVNIGISEERKAGLKVPAGKNELFQMDIEFPNF